MKIECDRDVYSVPDFEQITGVYLLKDNLSYCLMQITKYTMKRFQEEKHFMAIPQYFYFAGGDEDNFVLYPKPDKDYELKIKHITTNVWS